MFQQCSVCNSSSDFTNISCDCPVCSDCLLDWIKYKNEESLNLNKNYFPCAKCQVEIGEEHFIQNYYQHEKFNEITDILNNKLYITSDDYIKCPKQGCEFVGFREDKNENKICREPFICGKCKYEWSEKENNIDDNSNKNVNMIMKTIFDELSEFRIKLFTKPCTSCYRNINKFVGCDHITCLCKNEFCFNCLGEWSNHDRNWCSAKKNTIGALILFLIIILFFEIILVFNPVYLVVYYTLYHIMYELIGILIFSLTFYFLNFNYKYLISEFESKIFQFQIKNSSTLSEFIKKHYKIVMIILNIFYLWFIYKMFNNNETVNYSVKLVFYEGLAILAIYCFNYLRKKMN